MLLVLTGHVTNQDTTHLKMQIQISEISELVNYDINFGLFLTKKLWYDLEKETKYSVWDTSMVSA